MINNHSLSMYTYNIWANNTLLNHLKLLPQGVCRTEINSVFPTIFDTLMHIYVIDSGWYSLLTNAYPSDDYEAIKAAVDMLVAELKDLDLEEFGNRQQALASSLEDFIQTNDMSKVDRYAGVKMSYGDVFMHIVNHGTYHRGNITAMLHQLGHKGVPTDYGVYLYYTQQS